MIVDYIETKLVPCNEAKIIVPKLEVIQRQEEEIDMKVKLPKMKQCQFLISLERDRKIMTKRKINRLNHQQPNKNKSRSIVRSF